MRYLLALFAVSIASSMSSLYSTLPVTLPQKQPFPSQGSTCFVANSPGRGQVQQAVHCGSGLAVQQGPLAGLWGLGGGAALPSGQGPLEPLSQHSHLHPSAYLGQRHL